MVKTRSTNNRAGDDVDAAETLWVSAVSASRSSSSPKPVCAEVMMMLLGVSPRDANSDSVRATSAVVASCVLASAFVRATTMCRTCINMRMSRCSTVCGFQPSPMSMTRSAMSTPCTPATMVLRKSMWPGTSTKLSESV